jgi:hypothetical protein
MLESMEAVTLVGLCQESARERERESARARARAYEREREREREIGNYSMRVGIVQ